MYGMPSWGDAFSPRQQVALTTFADLVGETQKAVDELQMEQEIPFHI